MDWEKELAAWQKELEKQMVREASVHKYSVENEIKRLAYQEYRRRSEEERLEFIDGVIYDMAAPSEKHQDLLLEFGARFRNYLHGKTCKPFVAPFDVRIDFLDGGNSEVQPDIMVVCDREKLDGKQLLGPPDLIIEVLSPSSIRRDRVIKYTKYLQVGVREYWIVDPEKEEVLVNLLTDDQQKYVTKTYKKGDVIDVLVLDDLAINVTDLFDGYQGKEILEVEIARMEERERAAKERLQYAENLIAMGMTVEDVAKAMNLSTN